MSTYMKIFFFHFVVHYEEEEIQDCHFQRVLKSPKTIYNTKEIVIPLIATLTSSTAETEEESEEHMLQQYRRSYILLQNQDITRAQ